MNFAWLDLLDWPSMQSYDIIMLLVVGGATLWGAIRGMAWQVASIASVLVSSFVAARYSEKLAPHVSENPATNHLIAMLLLYLLTSFAIWMTFRLVARFIDRVHLQSFDRQVGALFGASKGVLWCLLITFFAVTMSVRTRQGVLASRSGYYIAALIHRGEPLLPPKIHGAIGEYLDQLDRGLDPTVDPLPGVVETPAREAKK